MSCCQSTNLAGVRMFPAVRHEVGFYHMAV